MNLATLVTLTTLWVLVCNTHAVCNCKREGLIKSFREAEFVFRAETTDLIPNAVNGNNWYETRNLHLYKPCPPFLPTSVVVVTKPTGCGLDLRLFTTYLFTGNLDHRLIVDTNTGPKQIVYVSISKCLFTSIFSKLSKAQLTQLNRLHDGLHCKPSCNAASCGIANLPNLAYCPGLNNTLPKVICTYLNATNACGYEILPCPNSP